MDNIKEANREIKMNFSVFKRTSDNWYGNYLVTSPYDIELVEVSFYGNIAAPLDIEPCYRVGVWGNDDCGMEFDTSDEKLALSIFMEIIGWEDVKKKRLSDLGFKSA